MDFIEILKAVLLGLVQGFTEFLPVSSSGHLILLEELGILEPSLFFNVMLHAGTLLAVVVVYYKKLYDLIRHPVKNKLLLYAAACIPTGIIALLVEKFLPNLLTGAYLPLCFMVTALILFSAEYFKPKNLTDINYPNSLICGTAQGIAVLPGISRSGATIATLILLGVPRDKAADFSFMLSVPIILLSCGYEAVNISSFDLTVSVWAVVIGIAAAFISGLVAIKLMLKIIKTKSFYPFYVYLTALSILSFILL